MKKFSINCDFGGEMSPFSVYIGKPEPRHHPLHFQAEWLGKERGGNVPNEVMTSISKLNDLAKKNGVALEELCVYALGAAQQEGGETAEEEEEEVGEASE
jgi:hypothetical protein